jgi:hypothetical protein
MNLKTWKYLSTDTETRVEVPYVKMVEIITLNGGRVVGTITSKDYVHYIVSIPDDRMQETFTIIKDLRAKGFPFDGIEPEQ